MAALCAVGFSASAQTRLWIQSDPGDYIGQGQTETYTSPANAFVLNSSSPSHVAVGVGGYVLNLQAPPSRVLGAGPYEAAGGYPFQGNSPGIDFSGNGRGCAGTGRFVILAVSFSGSGAITSLAVDFEQHCDAGAPALWGELRYNSSLPFTHEKPPGSTVPDNFTFGGELAVQPSALVTSLATTIYGINAPASISVVNGEYSVNGGPFLSATGTVANRDKVSVRGVSSATPGDVKYVTLVVGGDATGSFTIATYATGTPQTGLVINSYPGDYVGGGRFLYAHAPDWTLAFGPSTYTRIDGTGTGGRYFTLSLRGPNDAALAVGPYEEADRAPFADVSPGLDFSMDGASCNAVFGRFVVLEINLATNPKKLAVNFEQWCEGTTAPLFGELRINSAIPYFFQAPAGDSLPDAMELTPYHRVAAGSIAYSNYTRIYGTNAPVPISISGGGEYSVDGGPFTSAPGTVNELAEIQVRLKASTAPNGTRTAVLDTGGRQTPFIVTTYGPGTTVNGLYFRSSAGDYIGVGETRYYPGPPTTHLLQPWSGSAWYSIIKVPGATQYTFFVGAANNAQLTPGIYENALGNPGTGDPRLSFGGNGRGCDPVGRFVVHEATYSGAQLVRLAVDFEQRCGVTEPPLWGQVRINSTIPFSRYLAANKAQDMSGEGYGDLAWQNADGRHALWTMNGLAATGSAEILGAGTGWTATHAGDFDGDGKTDLVWQHTDGRVALYMMNGLSASSTQQILNAGTGWSVSHVADLNADGKSDLVFRNTDGSVAVWTMNGTAMTGGSGILGPGTGWSVTKTGDFNGDGKADLLWTHADGRVAIWLMDGTTVAATNQILNAGSGWSAAHVAELSGDGKADIVWQHTDGSVAIWTMNGAAVGAGAGILAAGSGWGVAFTGDFDGDGKADLLFQHPDGRAAIWLMDGLKAVTQTQILNPAGGWTVRKLLDLNGDGRADILWRHTDGRYAAWLMFGTAMSSGSQILGAGTGWDISPLGQ
ncbi:hypothetical protein BWI17_14570 [Betaproteobacteria bacterium GR16-43]|nr:hypothetical protein BWI17_14570 [Betaproteobacteria bacterium GR16-43]